MSESGSILKDTIQRNRRLKAIVIQASYWSLKEVFAQMLDSVTQYKQSTRKHHSRGVASKLSYADKIFCC